jgi:hypothetical protein
VLIAALSTEHKVLLAGMAAVFIVFSLVSSFVLPRRDPTFPGRNLRWYLLATFVLWICMLASVELFAKEEPEEHEGIAALIKL